VRLERARLAAGGLAVTCWLLALPAAVHASEPDRALQPLQPPAAAAPRGAPVLRQEWAQRGRPADRFGPLPLRPQDAALLAAARTGRWAEARALLQPEGGALPAHADASDDSGASALVLAAAAGEQALLRALLARGADIERRGDNGFTPLGAAAFHGQLGALRLLLRAGADPARPGATGHTALHLAAIAGQTAAVTELLRAGVPIDLLNAQRETALDVAGAAGQATVMDLLIQGGADLIMAGRR
jgi:uncharacterized protein